MHWSNRALVWLTVWAGRAPTRRWWYYRASLPSRTDWILPPGSSGSTNSQPKKQTIVLPHEYHHHQCLLTSQINLFILSPSIKILYRKDVLTNRTTSKMYYKSSISIKEWCNIHVQLFSVVKSCEYFLLACDYFTTKWINSYKQ